MLRAALVALGIAVASASAEAAQINSYTVGNWSVGAYTNDSTGHFGNCLASASYNSGITFFVFVSRDYQWDLGFSAQNWKLHPGDRIPLRYRFDRSAWTGATAEVMGENLVRIPMPSNGPVAERFRRGRTMEVHDGNQSYFFNLNGTSQLLVSLVQCVQTSISTEQGVASNPTTNPALPPGRAADHTDAPAPDVTALKLEGTRVLSNFLLAAELPGAELLGDNDFPKELSFAHAVAVAGGMIGFSVVVPTAEFTADAVAAQISGALSENCEGKFSTGSTKEIVQSVKLINAFTACRNSAGQALLQYVVVSRKEGGQYVIGVLSESADVASNKPAGAEPPLDSKRLINAAFKVSQ